MGVPLGLAVLWTIHMLLLRQVHASGVFELRLDSFTNSLGLNEEGNCCNGVRSVRTGLCSASCRTFFRVCLKHFQNHIRMDEACTFGTIISPVIGNNSFEFPDTLNSFTNPVRLPFDFAWPGTFSLIIEAWHDTTLQGPTQGSPRELVSRLATQSSVSVGETWIVRSHKTENTDLRYRYRVVCDKDYFGDTCTAICIPRNDGNGHFTCNKNGSIECLEGWTDPDSFCQKAVCMAGCDPERGECIKPNECLCRDGWQGRLCNECVPYPGCQHGTCSKPWECNCNEGWGGLFCNQDLNYCTHHTPCRNGATCHNTGEGLYKCTCAPGFTGTNCEKETDDCLHHSCLNGGTCEDVGARYQCRCMPGFHGRHCESSARSCEEEPCKNGGTCASLHDGYRCTCRPGYTGANCANEIDECASNPCLHGGSCVDELNGYRCVCNPGYTGPRCQNDNNDCSHHPCLNGGTCDDRINDFQCRCVPGFVGPLCQTNVDDCENFPCANGGTCHDAVNNCTCTRSR